jgi:hypothetical protein
MAEAMGKGRNGWDFHPIADIFPLIDGEGYGALVEDIREHGFREPVVLHEGAILDGRNRYRACQDAGVDTRFEMYDGDDPLAYVVSLNLKRRHLSESQRAMVAAKIANLGRGANQHTEGLPIGRSSRLLNVSERSVARAAVVRDHGDCRGGAGAGHLPLSLMIGTRMQKPNTGLAMRNGGSPGRQRLILTETSK